MTGALEALHVYDEANRPILSHVFASRPLSAAHLLPLYLSHPSPRPSFIYLPNTSPSTLLFSLNHANLLFLLTASSEIEPLLALEFLHRVVDVFEEFLGSPLLSSKIESNYDVVAQLLNEMCDAGVVNTTEGNALRDLVEVEGWIGKLLGGINIPGKPGFTSNSGTSVTAMPGISSLGASASSTPALPWRRANVRHTSNELYVDFVESLSVIIAPSGRPLAAFANGTIAFTAKISGVPDVLLTLSSPSGKHNLDSVMELPVFHPCVRLAKWKERPGELSFVPPDGRFVLAGYEVDLLPYTANALPSSSALKLPVTVEVKTSLGPTGTDFEVRTAFSKVAATLSSSSISSSTFRSGSRGPNVSGNGSSVGHTSSPTLEDLTITIPIPADVRTLSDIRASRGDTSYNPGDSVLEWHIPAKQATPGNATLHCTAVGFDSSLADDDVPGFAFASEYDYEAEPYQSATLDKEKEKEKDKTAVDRDEKLVERNRMLMPSSARVSFSVKGWLASGIRVESLTVDARRSRGLGEGVKPYKGVKYLSVSRGGIEVRC